MTCQITPAKCGSTTLAVGASDSRLKAHDRILYFDGWTKVTPTLYKDDEGRTLSAVDKSDALALVELTLARHFIRSPARFSETLLVKGLEKHGTGYPSIYTSIISTIQGRDYVRVKDRRFHAEEMGEIVTDHLEGNFRGLMSYDFTARMGNGPDQVANHEAG